jgi:hypothetical protein
MITGLWRRTLLLATGLTLLLGACSAASAPAATSVPNGTASAPSAQASVPAQPSVPAPAGSASEAVAASDACALLTKAEVEAAFGETMLAPVSSVDHGDATCTWAHSAGGLDLTVAIGSTPSSAAGLKGAEALYGAAATDVPGIGDAAFDFQDMLIQFVKGTTLVTVGTGDGPAIISPDHFKGLAKAVAGRL